MGKNQRLKVHRQWLPGRSLCSIRSNRKWCKRRGSSLECQNCFFVYPIIDSNLKNLSLTFYHILSQNSILRLPKSSLPTALSAHIYTLSFNTIFSAHTFILFINPTHFIRSCIFSCSFTPCFSSICFTKVSTCSLVS